MGLSIYFHKAKDVRYPGDELQTPEFYHRIADDRARHDITKKVEELIVKVVNHNGEYGWDFVNKEIKPFLGIHESNYGWLFSKLDPSSAESLVHFLFNVIGWFDCDMAEVSFSKVKFIYRYFSNRLEDDSCIVTEEDVMDIIERCKKVLADNSLAKELLPTIGKPDYDEYYFYDVEDCQREMETLLEDYDETTDVMWVDMSGSV